LGPLFFRHQIVISFAASLRCYLSVIKGQTIWPWDLGMNLHRPTSSTRRLGMASQCCPMMLAFAHPTTAAVY